MALSSKDFTSQW